MKLTKPVVHIKDINRDIGDVFNPVRYDNHVEIDPVRLNYLKKEEAKA